MAQIILDISANTHKNDWTYLKRMLDELKAVDTGKHEVIIKHQLFQKAGENIPLDLDIFESAYFYARDLGYKTTSSVFDKESLDYLLTFDVPFIKIANNRSLDWLIGEIPRRIPIYKSVGNIEERFGGKKLSMVADTELACVSKYPATIADYERTFSCILLVRAISDHTTNWDLFNKYQPQIIEVHYKLDDSTGLDAGSFARTPSQLAEVL
jgi:sialic acid synthase SpsE